jgi:glycosyltransferase involved in cell wall biosynthesis
MPMGKFSKKILILSGGHLCHNPRAVKEATTLAEAGYDVEVLGGWFDPVLKARDLELIGKNKFQFRPLHDLTEQAALRFGLRVRGRLASTIHSTIGHENHWQLGYFVSALQKEIRNCKADLVIAHSEPALWAISQFLISDSKPKLGVDMEDWFSEDLPPETRKHRPVKLLRNMEQSLLRNAAHTTCTSRAMSDALAKEYGCRPPDVIYNAFPWADRQKLDGQFKDRKNRALSSIHWYSQTLGAGRGLEDLFAALRFVKHEAEIHLRGKPVVGFEDWLAGCISEKWRKQVFIHELVSNDELLSRIAEHDIGFAGEMRYCKNKEFTVSNKILHYLLGGLAVVASDTTGQREVAEQADGAVRIYPSGNPESLAKELNILLSSPEILRASKTAALASAEKIFCWERQTPVLLQGVHNAVSP